MKICVFGAGAIGGFLGARLIRAGLDVTLIARGVHLDAIREKGLHMIEEGETYTVEGRAVGTPLEAGPQDVVFITLKSHSAVLAAQTMAPMLGPDTVVVTAMNGIPWWYFYGEKGRFENHRLESVDPGGRQWNAIGPERVLGCVLYPATEIVAPGIIRHMEGNRFILGEPGGEKSARCKAIAEALTAAGLKAPISPRIRDDIWIKLWGNLALNPISVLSGLTLEEIVSDDKWRGAARAVMLEAREIGEQLGIRFRIDVDRRIAGSGEIGAHKTSMLQDFEAGREMEIDALVTVIQEIGRLVDVPSPRIDDMLDKLRAKIEERRKI
ncbi:MAG: 2-dehydropantoate 2-reductase [Rhodospirillaceae bacterium]|jgi:2-dehydropantoate 2-reductase|nr:2-dehydropantoate 2-reductase [Rhodospirillaceae bacterium]MBT5374682.1 2-dehydropantoate 2-reductase [Rhodospirillaceae bacterium]MBT5659035.1 2-dehydropantoate 2-reductase [Rhodospirillaceae bacterium]MBT5751177.1 2-dehydropantoate 2-reductase [Rhodospirillaceae bacterium]